MGGSSSGGGHTPKEAPESGRSKQLVKIIEVISEGEVQGLVDGVKTVFLDNTPIQNADNSYNFSNVEAQGRIGTQDQTILDGFNTTEKEVSVGTEVKKTTPLTRTVTDAQVNRIRLTLGVSSLFKQEDNGDTNGTNVDLKITVGKQVYTVNFNGKYSAQFLKNIIIDNLPAVPFTIKVERVQADSTSQRLQNKTLWASYTEIIDTQFAYPNTALVGIKFDSEYFSQIPNRTYEIYGIKVKVPSNYDPTTRAYTGLWDGTFKIAYSDNPAWVLMDIVTNKRYGLGQRLGEFGVDKWALYQVAQYCDQLVPDGFGNQEPRFTCNVWLTEQRSAYDVINDICSIFRAMPVWNGTELTVIMDRPADPVWTYTNANVIGGFSRQYSAMKARHNAVQVEYQDKANSYQTAIEYVSNDDSIRKYGLNLKKVKAFGCTSRGQAYRTGRWILETEQLETETITFTVGAEGLMHIPGDIIRVADTQYAGVNIGGRVQAINGRNVTLDREIEINGNSYFQYFNANAKATQIKISSVKGKVITLDSEPRGLTVMGVWSLAAANITARLYRAMGVSENDDGSYTITALQHEPQKEAIVDNGASFETTSTTLHNLPKLEHLDVGINGDKINFNWQTTSGIGTLSYDIKILKAGKLYRLEKGLTSPEFSLDDMPNGDYEVIIIAKNASGQVVSEKSQSFTIDKPPAPTNVRVMGGLSDITLEWDYINEFTQTEIFVSTTNQLSSAVKLAKVFARTYVHNVGAKQTRYYWVRHIRGINIGPFYQQQGLKGESGVDIDAELEVLNQKLSENIVNDVIDTALPARNLELVKTVDGLNLDEYQGYKQVYNTIDGKLYTWNGRKYSSKISADQIEGVISESQLDQSLIKQLNQNSQTVSTLQTNLEKETQNRIKAIQVESEKLSASIQAEANLRGTAIRKLEDADKQQAQQISTITAKADNALTGLQQERTARVAGDKAESEARIALTSRIANTEANINNMQKSVSDTNKSISEVNQSLNAKFNDLSVGGRNYLANSLNLDSLWLVGKSSDETGISKIENGVISITSNTKNYNSASQSSREGTHVNNRNYSTTLNNLRSGIYSISFYAKSDKNGRVRVILRQFKKDGTILKDVYRYVTINSRAWQRYTLTLNYEKQDSEQYNFVRFEFTCYEANGVTIEIKHPKLELGTIATDWTPAPEDLEQSIAEVSADLTSYKSTQATKEQAIAQRIDNVQTSINHANAQISTVSKAITTTEGKLNATHTIKTETISGGKLAIAGISLGASTDGKTAESSVIVMADKFNVVKNKSDGNPVSVFSVANNKTVLKGDLIATGSITAEKLATDSVTTGALQAGAVRTEHIATAQISADKLAVGLGGNLLQNPIFANNSYGWDWAEGDLVANTVATNISRAFRTDHDASEYRIKDALPTETLLYGRITGNFTTKTTNGWFDPLRSAVLSVNKGQTYIFSVYLGFYRCLGDILIEQYSTDGTKYEALITSKRSLTSSSGMSATAILGTFKGGLANVNRQFVKFTAPSTGKIRIIIRLREFLGNNPDYYIARPMLEEVASHVAEPSPWQNSGVTAIHGGSIVTQSITTQQLAAGSVTANQIAANLINANHIASKSINSSHIVTKSLSADLLNVSSLSAISANLGTVTAGRITGTTIEGNNISGGSITGTTIQGGLVKGSRIEGGVISGTTILGDIVKAIILKKSGNNFIGYIPSSETSSRTVVIPSFSFKAEPGETSILSIWIDGVKVSEQSITGIDQTIPIHAVINPTEITGNIQLTLSTEVSGNVSGSVSGRAAGTVNGMVNGKMVSGQVSGQVSGTASGRASGRASGTASGRATRRTPLTNINTSFKLQIPTYASISGFKQINSNSVSVEVRCNNNFALAGISTIVALVA